jgi:hypothetical protein
MTPDALQTGHPSKIAEVRVNKTRTNIAALLLTLALCAAGLGLARLLPHHRPPTLSQAHLLLVLIAVLVPVHEGLHALGLLLFGRVSWQHIRFGVMWHALMPYCACTIPIPIPAYRRMALLPLQVTGALALIALFIFPSDVLGLFVGITLATCIGDVCIVLKLRPFSDNLLAFDSPTEIGCDIYSAPSATSDQ